MANKRYTVEYRLNNSDWWHSLFTGMEQDRATTKALRWQAGWAEQGKAVQVRLVGVKTVKGELDIVAIGQ